MKNNNKQKFNNIQKNINIKAWWDVNNWIINNQNDNLWYSIPKENSSFYENLWKLIISKLWEKWWIISSIILIITWCITWIIYFIKYFLNFDINLNFKNTSTWLDFSSVLKNIFSTINLDWIMWMLWFLLFFLWIFISNIIKYKNNRECPKCKNNYSLIEVWEPKEKEIKTSKWYRVTQIRNYECNKCKFKKNEEVSFIRNWD